MKNRAFYILIIVALCFSFCFVSCKKKTDSSDSSASSAGDTLVISERSIELTAGESARLSATDKEGNVVSVSWTSNKTNVATVDNGVVIGVSAGYAVIKAYTSGGASALCGVTVTDGKTVSLLSVIPSVYNLSLYAGDTFEVSAEVKFGNKIIVAEVGWTVSDSSVALIDKNGKITAVSNGTAIVTATAAYKETAASAQIAVSVYKSGVFISPDFATKTIIKGDIAELTVSVFDGTTALEPTAYELEYTSSDTNIATVNGNKLSALKYGNTVITVNCTVQGTVYSFTQKLHVYGQFPVDFYNNGVLERTSNVRYGEIVKIQFASLSSSRKFKYYSVNGIKTDNNEFVMPDESVRVEAVYVNDTDDDFSSSFEKGTIYYNQGEVKFVGKQTLPVDKNGNKAYGNGAIRLDSPATGSVQFDFEKPIAIAANSVLILRFYRPDATKIIYFGNNTKEAPVWIGNQTDIQDVKAKYRYVTVADLWTEISIPLTCFGAVGETLDYISFACSDNNYVLIDNITVK